MENINNEKLLEQLSAVYGKTKAGKILEKIIKFKNKNPHKIYSFVFDEEGNFKTFEKELGNISLGED